MTNPRRVRANPGEGARLREQILIAAERLLVDGGNEAAITMRAVAAGVGVTTPSVYLHFPDKAALVTAVCLRVWDQVSTRMSDAAQDFEDPLIALRASARAYVEFGLEHPVQYRLLLMRPPGTVQSTEQAAAAEACLAVAEAGARRCVEAGILRGDPHELARQMWVTVHGLVTMLISAPPFPEPADREAFIGRTLGAAGLGIVLMGRMPPGAGPLSPAELVDRLDRVVAGITPGG